MRCLSHANDVDGLILASLATSAAVAVKATEGVLRVKCKWLDDTDMTSLQTEKAVGETEFTYEPTGDLTGTMMKDGLSAVFVAATSNDLIEGIAHHSVYGDVTEERVELNRKTGDILYRIKTPTSTHVLRGTCIRLSGPDFGK